jgi:CopA family copper-resistance protein
MERNKQPRRPAQTISRRRFVQGMLAGDMIAGLDLLRWPLFAIAAPSARRVLSRTNFDLVIEELPVNFTGQRSVATAINGQVPGPLLRWRQGDSVTISVTNRLKVPTSIHWHGIREPAHMDGGPGLSYAGIAPGETFVYRFPVRQRGTYWYHSHSGFQDQTGLYGPLVLDSSEPDPIGFDREYVVLLSDWTDTDPHTVFSNLKQQSDYYNFHQRTVGTFFSDVRGPHYSLWPKPLLKRAVENLILWGFQHSFFLWP